MNQRILLYLMLLIMLFYDCGPKVMIPPVVDLRNYNKVGFIDFACDAEGNLDDCVNERFLETITKYQKNATIIKLGTQEEVLQAITLDRLDAKALQAIGQRYNVSAVIAGTVDVTEVTTIAELPPDYAKTSDILQIEGMKMKAKAKISITAVLWNTDQDTTVWTSSVSGEEMVEQVSVLSDGKIVFDAKTYRSAYRDLVKPLIKALSKDFKIRYKRI